MVVTSAPFSTEAPCIVCGAGMAHRPDGHADWCAEQGAFNATLTTAGWPDWFQRRLRAMTPALSGRQGQS